MGEEAGDAEDEGEPRAKPKMGAVDEAVRLPGRLRVGIERNAVVANVDIDRPLQEDESGQNCGPRHRSNRRVGAPSNGNGPGDENKERDQRHQIVLRGEHEEACAEQIGAERDRRDEIDAAFLCLRSEQEARDDQKRREREASDNVDDMRREHVARDIADARQHPSKAEANGDESKPAPEFCTREPEGSGGDDGEIEIERPVVRRLGGDDRAA